MGNNMYSQIKNSGILLTICLGIIFTLFLISSTANAQNEDKLFITLTNSDYEEIERIFENEEFYVSVYSLDENGTPTYLVNVIIEFNFKNYEITAEEPELVLVAPEVSRDSVVSINANKSGYISAQREILVENKLHLIIIPDDYTVDANKQFSVLVMDEDQNPVEGVLVGIQSYTGDDSVKITNTNGRVWLVAPGKRSEIVVIAQKEGYVEGSTTLGVNINPGLLESFLKSPFTPIVIAVFLLLVSILVVNYRQRKLVRQKTIEIATEHAGEHRGSYGKIVTPLNENEGPPLDKKRGKRDDHMKPSRGPKIEEIRISRPRRDKEIVNMDRTKEAAKTEIPRKARIKHDYDWFEGTEYIRYEIDRMTGGLDEDGVDKWFEGIDEIREKIDEKLRKKDLDKGK
jgi:hypothetical protein